MGSKVPPITPIRCARPVGPDGAAVGPFGTGSGVVATASDHEEHRQRRQ